MANVLFVCKQNAGRSQMSEAFFRRAAAGHDARSAGTVPAVQVNPVVVEAMGEVGVDLTGRSPRALDAPLVDWAELVVTMGCGDACPVLPGKRYLEWQVEDPAGQPLARVRQIRDEIRQRVEQLIATLD